MLMVLFSCLLAQTALCVNDDIVLELHNLFDVKYSNATFKCEIRRNTTSGLRWLNETLEIEWLFTPAHSNKTFVILSTGQKECGFPGLSNGQSIDNGQNGQDGAQNTVKYYREVWPDVTIIKTQPGDAGTYTCRVVNFNISVSAELYIIDSSPVCNKSNLGPEYYEGEKVNLTCALGYHGNHVPQLEWMEPKLHVDYAHLIVRHHNTEKLVSSSLELQLQHMIDGKLFRCKAKFMNITSEVSCDTSFPPASVKYKPFITHIKTSPYTEEHGATVQEASNLTLFCTGHGNPPPRWTWSFFTTTGQAFLLDCNSTVCPLYWLRRSDTGTYQCNISNEIQGKRYSDHKEVYIKVLPSSTVYPYSSTDGPVAAKTKSTKISPYAIAAVVCASIAVILIIIFIFMALKMRRREARLHKRLSRMQDENFDDQEVELLDEHIHQDNSELPLEYGRLKQQWEIPRKDVRCTERIAKGTFVEVWQGKMRKYPRRNGIMKVAVKKIVAEATEKERKFFLAELEIMRAIQPHPNILPLIGCYTASDPWLMMVEYAVDGSLYQFLQLRRPGDLRVQINSDSSDTVSMKNNNITAHKLICMAAQIVNGLQHMNRYKMIFYRLRSANILVCKGEVCKLSGFGFAQDITERNTYESNSAPVRWMSPESLLENVFSIKTDVWSFGILLWEIVHFGHLPYPDMGPQEVLEKIQTGYRMSQPPHCSGDIYNLMLMCWAEDPDNRPGLDVIMQKLATMADHADKHIHMDRLPDGLRSSDIIENMETIA